MGKNLLIASHDKAVGNMLEDVARRNGYGVVCPQSEGFLVDEFRTLLDQRPIKVLMDVNYGKWGSNDISPIITVAELMKEREYDLQTSLLGITGNPLLAEETQKKNRINVATKTDIRRVFGFLS
ncbi:MAG: hypothetical protein AABW80_05330 [Nanoarchaeota archaeon]